MSFQFHFSMIFCLFCAFYCVDFLLYITVLLPVGVIKDDDYWQNHDLRDIL